MIGEPGVPPEAGTIALNIKYLFSYAEVLLASAGLTCQEIWLARLSVYENQERPVCL